MLKSKNKSLFFIIAVFLLAFVLYQILQDNLSIVKGRINTIDRRPLIRPDYSEIVIPPNIAPLNFYINEPADGYYIKIYSKVGKEISIYSRWPSISMPIGRWRALLNKNKGSEIYFDICSYNAKTKIWHKFSPITNTIANEGIDSFLVYRDIVPQFYNKVQMKIWQRNLENYDNKLVLDSQTFNGGCFNCHTFLKNKAQKFIIQARNYGLNYMAVSDNGKVSLITPQAKKPGSSYLSWHPDGEVVALVVNMSYKVFDLFCGTSAEETLEYGDTDGDIAIYDLKTNTLTAVDGASNEERVETQPNWSPDGKYLYFLSAPRLPIEEYRKIKYDLRRVSYDIKTNTWGRPETLIYAGDSGLGVSFPKASPDGKYLLFCMTDRSSFSILRSATDIYLMDIASAKYRKLEINSDRTDSYHSWSSNSRWFVFVSKRDDGVFGRVYFSHIDTDGNASKPFILPQYDPYHYEAFPRTYNVPELISEPLRVNRFFLGKKIAEFDKIINTRSGNNSFDSGIRLDAGKDVDDKY